MRSKKSESNIGFRGIHSEPLINFLTAVEEMMKENIESAVGLIYEKVEANEDDIQQAITAVLKEACKTVRTPSESMLKTFAKLLQCSICFNTQQCTLKKSPFDSPITIKQKASSFVIYAQGFLLNKEADVVEADISRALLKELQLHFHIFASLVQREPLDLRIIKAHQENMLELAELEKKLLAVEKRTRLAKGVTKVVRRMQKEEVGPREHMENAISALNQETISHKGVCGHCFKATPLHKFPCSHSFCLPCIQKHFELISGERLPKCLLPTCFCLIDKEDTDSNYSYPSSAKLTSMCGFCSGSSNLVAYDRVHRMCYRCLRGYVEQCSEGQIFCMNAETRELAVESISCPLECCSLDIASDVIEGLYSKNEVKLLRRQAEMLYEINEI
eukprot:TRINITY_DN10426_c0_g6_i1.p1 TRINITY_DN10426_c0_g6~~TRINITY_DN10426_c0_g6_i1.p1  ORF type:complete len:389 (+),score=80.80 TRINITY_DN10426_c0_g6_i1:426-1592(+)